MLEGPKLAGLVPPWGLWDTCLGAPHGEELARLTVQTWKEVS